MPRKRKAARSFRREGALTPEQHEYMVCGFVLAGPPYPFRDEAEERDLWRRHRTELLTKCEPGRRPLPYYAFDLREARLPSRWWQELAILEARGLLSKDEEIRLERAHGALDPNQGASFLDPQYIGTGEGRGTPSTLESRLHGLRENRNEAQFLADWHRRRGRTELERKYTMRAAVFEGKISDLAGGNSLNR